VRPALWIRAATGLGCAAAPASAQLLYDNGPLLTSPNTCMAVPGGTASELPLPNASLGFRDDLLDGWRLADNFSVPTPGWMVGSVVVFAYQTLAPLTPVPMSSVNFRVWSGLPGQPGSTIVYGDALTNRFTTGSLAQVYRVARTGFGCGTVRPVFTLQCTIAPPLSLAPGVYWLDFQTQGDPFFDGPFVPPVTITGMAGKPGADALQYDPNAGTWGPVTDALSGAAQDVPFRLYGSSGPLPMCYANCDGSTAPPILNVADFSCFLNRFTAGDSYANCDDSTNPPVLNVQDFACFLNTFAAGCL